ncbi:MAG: hypothetical protein OEN50_18435, partial [Deltaproteobacteria bacterium]|nr:hypothetical protein [Deltaproteobacteria bacterium]
MLNTLNPMRVKICLALSCFLIAGCADFARWVRQYTYPPDFRYIERDQLRSTMWQLAYHSRELNREMGITEKQQPDRAEIVTHLQAMEQAAARLDTTGWPSNHPLVDMNLPNFRRDIKFAREAVERDPPNYVLADHV